MRFSWWRSVRKYSWWSDEVVIKYWSRTVDKSWWWRGIWMTGACRTKQLRSSRRSRVPGSIPARERDLGHSETEALTLKQRLLSLPHHTVLRTSFPALPARGQKRILSNHPILPVIEQIELFKMHTHRKKNESHDKVIYLGTVKSHHARVRFTLRWSFNLQEHDWLVDYGPKAPILVQNLESPIILEKVSIDKVLKDTGHHFSDCSLVSYCNLLSIVL